MTRYIKLFFRRIGRDFRQRELLPLKLLFFIQASTVYIIYPYLTIQMRELGISVEETAIMSAIIPIIAILMPPLAGLIADKIGNFKILLAIFSAFGGLSSLILLLVPIGRVTIMFPEEALLDLSCTPNSTIHIFSTNDYPCNPVPDADQEIDVQIESCGFLCHANLDENDTTSVLNAKKYGVEMHNVEANSTLTFSYQVVHPQPEEILAAKRNKKAPHYDFTKNTVRKLSKNTYFFPTASLYNFSCDVEMDENDNENQRIACVFGTKTQLEQLKGTFEHHFAVKLISQPKDETDVEENRRRYNTAYIKSKGKKYGSMCMDGFPEQGNRISVTIPMVAAGPATLGENLHLGSCSPRCLATTPRKNMCTDFKSIIEYDAKRTFWSYLGARVVVGIIGGTVFAMFEGAVIAILREHKADYGLQRIYATIGGMISSPVSGWLIDFASQGKEHTDFRLAFFLYAILKVLSAVLMLFINLEFKSPASNVISDVFSVLKKVELIALFVACFMLGLAWGFIENFLFWLLEDLGGSKSLMGITITVGGIAGLPLLVLSGPIIKRIGHANVIFIGFVFYAIRLLGYSLIYNPWLCLIFEAMESITSSLSFTAIVTYAAKLSTMTTDTSIQGITGGLYYGVGKGAGGLIGGYLIQGIGMRSTYKVFSLTALITGVIYFTFNYFYMRNRESEGVDITKKDVEQPPTRQGTIRNKVSNGIREAETLPYEEAITNLGYEDTENDESSEGPTDPPNDDADARAKSPTAPAQEHAAGSSKVITDVIQHI